MSLKKRICEQLKSIEEDNSISIEPSYFIRVDEGNCIEFPGNYCLYPHETEFYDYVYEDYGEDGIRIAYVYDDRYVVSIFKVTRYEADGRGGEITTHEYHVYYGLRKKPAEEKRTEELEKLRKKLEDVLRSI